MGILFALLAALSWTVAAYGFRHLGGVLSPLQLNFWKGLLACIGLLAIIMATGQWVSIPTELWRPLLLSGFIGITLGDTFIFSALNRIGERTTLSIAESAAPLFAILLGMLWLAEFLTLWQWLGAALIIPALIWVLEPKAPSHRSNPWLGMGFALGAALCQALGMVFMREVFLAVDMPSVQAAFLRLAAGIAAIPLIIAIQRHPFWPRLDPRQWVILGISTLVGTLLAIWFQQLAVKRLEAGVVQTLIATCAIMAFSIDRIRGHKASGKAWLGMGVALVGVGLIALTQ